MCQSFHSYLNIKKNCHIKMSLHVRLHDVSFFQYKFCTLENYSKLDLLNIKVLKIKITHDTLYFAEISNQFSVTHISHIFTRYFITIILNSEIFNSKFSTLLISIQESIKFINFCNTILYKLNIILYS